MLKRRCLDGLNRLLQPANLRLDTLTSARHEQRRLDDVKVRRGFDSPAYCVPPSFESASYDEVLCSLAKYQRRFASFAASSLNDVGFAFGNDYYSSPDAEVLYTIVRSREPRRILEIGCGHSTKVIAQAIRDGQLSTQHLCVDPCPREDVAYLGAEFQRVPIETLDASALAAMLQSGDVLFIDTSHELKAGNDGAFIYGKLLPRVGPGVIVHVHDIFLPYEYPHRWIADLGYRWTEQ